MDNKIILESKKGEWRIYEKFVNRRDYTWRRHNYCCLQIGNNYYNLKLRLKKMQIYCKTCGDWHDQMPKLCTHILALMCATNPAYTAKERYQKTEFQILKIMEQTPKPLEATKSGA